MSIIFHSNFVQYCLTTNSYLIILEIFSYFTFDISPTDILLDAALVGDPGRLLRIPRVTTDGLKVTSESHN